MGVGHRDQLTGAALEEEHDSLVGGQRRRPVAVAGVDRDHLAADESCECMRAHLSKQDQDALHLYRDRLKNVP